MTTFKEFLREDIFKILRDIKKKVSSILGEEIEDSEILKYMDYLAIFEQFLRHLDSNKTQLDDVIGFNTLVSVDKLNKDSLLKFITQYFKKFEQNESINFERISKSRAAQFQKWFEMKSKDGLGIIHSAADYVLNKLEKYKLNGRLMGV